MGRRSSGRQGGGLTLLLAICGGLSLLFFLLFGPRLPPLSEGAGSAVRPRGSGKHVPATASARRLRPHVAGREVDADVPYHVSAAEARALRGGDAGEGSEAEEEADAAPRKPRPKARKRAPATRHAGATEAEATPQRVRAKPRAKAAPGVSRPKPKPKPKTAGVRPKTKPAKAKPQRAQAREMAEVEEPVLVAPALAVPAHPHNKAGFDPTRVEILSLDRPRAFLYHDFLSEAECDHLVAISAPGLHKSGVVDAETGGSLISDIRTSSGSFVGRRADSTVAEIEARIAVWSQIPEDHGEAIQVLRYELGQEYRAHYDYFFHKAGEANNRVATVLLYLSDVEEGGETVFPNTAVPAGRDQSNYSECGRNGLAVKARKGNALLFWSMKVGGELDGGSSHAGCPVIKGTKWTATKWMHVAPAHVPDAHHKVYKEPRPAPVPGCEDQEDRCWSWAEQGECKRNPGFMLVTCRPSCDTCNDPPYTAPP